ncbi:MAG: hypothetical protein JNK87_16815 [Bryobacterales bacterium]|nr:hypothetical protein [Bryobacterales bacterium]
MDVVVGIGESSARRAGGTAQNPTPAEEGKEFRQPFPFGLLCVTPGSGAMPYNWFSGEASGGNRRGRVPDTVAVQPEGVCKEMPLASVSAVIERSVSAASVWFLQEGCEAPKHPTVNWFDEVRRLAPPRA